jgi:hypothetical protein
MQPTLPSSKSVHSAKKPFQMPTEIRRTALSRCNARLHYSTPFLPLFVVSVINTSLRPTSSSTDRFKMWSSKQKRPSTRWMVWARLWAHSADFSPRRGDPGLFADVGPDFAIASPTAGHKATESALKQQLLVLPIRR